MVGGSSRLEPGSGAIDLCLGFHGGLQWLVTASLGKRSKRLGARARGPGAVLVVGEMLSLKTCKGTDIPWGGRTFSLHKRSPQTCGAQAGMPPSDGRHCRTL